MKRFSGSLELFPGSLRVRVSGSLGDDGAGYLIASRPLKAKTREHTLFIDGQRQPVKIFVGERESSGALRYRFETLTPPEPAAT